MSRLFRRLRRDRRGVTAIEFGLLAPVMCLMLMGGYDLLHSTYMQDVLDGEMQKAGRESALEGAARKAPEIDEVMRRQMYRVMPPGSTVVTERKTNPSFLAFKPERFDDLNANGRRDRGECFDDIDGDKTWDLKPSRKGPGGANDVTILRATVTLPRLFPMAAMLGWTDEQTLVSETILKNQPYAGQANTAPDPICT